MIPDLVAELHPSRLPADFASAGAADLAAAFGLGLLVAALAVALLGPVLRVRARPPTLRQELARLRGLAPEERLMGQLALAAAQGVALPEDLRAGLYRGAPPEPERLEALLLGGRRGERSA